MDNRQTISEELNGISPFVAGLGGIVPLSTPPEGYFESLPGLILNRIRAGEASSPSEELNLLSPLLGKLDKQPVFSVPEGYFDNLSAGIARAAKTADEDPRISPLLEGLRERNVYTVPDQYFSEFPQQMRDKLDLDHRPAKVVSFGPARKMMRYAAAAVVTGVLIISGYLMLNTGSSTNDPVSGIRKISDAEMVNYLEAQNMPIYDAAYPSPSVDLNDDDVVDMLSDVPDETLKQYLAQYGDPKEMLVN